MTYKTHGTRIIKVQWIHYVRWIQRSVRIKQLQEFLKSDHWSRRYCILSGSRTGLFILLYVYCSRSTSRDYSVASPSPYPTASSSGSARMKGSYYTLTPFDTRRSATAAKSSDYNLTPFTSRISSDSSSTALQAAAAATTHGETPHAETPTEKSTKPRRSTLSDSSDSAEEPTDPAHRDPDVRYLTSRATSPMDPAERDVFIAADKTSPSGKGKVRNRLLARTKTKKYPVGDRKRRRQLKDVSVQVSDILV